MPDIAPNAKPQEVGPFIMNPEGVSRLFARGMMRDGPFPVHYEPFEAPIAMSWNFVARTRDELDDAHRDWAGVIAHGGSQRFGDVRSELGVVPAPGYPTGG